MTKQFLYFFDELDDSPEERYLEDRSMEVTRRFLCSYEHRLNAAAVLLGGGAEFPGGAGADEYSGFPELRVAEISIAPYSGYIYTSQQNSTAQPARRTHGNDGVPPLAMMELVYRTKDITEDPADGKEIGDGPITENPGQDPIVMEYDQRGHAEMMSIPARALRWDDAAAPQQLPADSHPYKLIALADHILTFHFVNTPPLGAMKSIRGKVNVAAFNIPVVNIGIAAEQGMFYDYDVRREWTINDVTGQPRRAWEVKYTIKERTIDGEFGWNHLYDPVDGRWKKAIAVGSGEPIYAKTSFAPAFIFR